MSTHRRARSTTVLAALASLVLLAGCTVPAASPADSSCDGVAADLLEIIACQDAAGVSVASSRLAAPALANDVVPSIEEVEDFIGVVIADADGMWVDYFTKYYPSFLPPQVEYTVIMPGFEHTSRCVDGSTGRPAKSGSHTPTAFYCSAGYAGQSLQANRVPIGEIVLASETMQDVWRGRLIGRPLTVVGDFAVAFVAAHEFGHHIADELSQQAGLPLPSGANNELMADCFAGVWAAHAYVEGMLEDGDVEEGLAAADAVGDLEGHVSPDPHGTGAQRQAAFLLGYTGNSEYPAGAPDACITDYWK